MSGRLLISVTYDPAKGYVAIHPELPLMTALSLGGLRRKIEIALLPESPEIKLELDKRARTERDHRRRGGPLMKERLWPRSTAYK